MSATEGVHLRWILEGENRALATLQEREEPERKRQTVGLEIYV